MINVFGKARLRWNPGFWFGSSIVAAALLVPTWLWGAFSGGLDVAETCTLGKGQRFDESYREGLGPQPSGPFPLHNMCNASYDLVPSWVNPMLACLAVIVTGSLIATVVTGIVQLRRVLSERRSGERPTV
ncbi:hypothetical protein GCM10018980_10510 [Streptomyces capoamus]|uniref:Uncharacterized protein n=1 Tax=Streptomyces capoamus TaxID=68183 RepID=A0A919C0Y5_9ACTN|nr:hypothetical protein [Streptomyces capoamus]GGW16958.1 hypothetical protein GCM10010501_35380 [Streptomyces libani subsp. rufus]GHG38107.1 hypothetical protein GCM10018980_10510 [Streptomyces capoamus]